MRNTVTFGGGIQPPEKSPRPQGPDSDPYQKFISSVRKNFIIGYANLEILDEALEGTYLKGAKRKSAKNSATMIMDALREVGGLPIPKNWKEIGDHAQTMVETAIEAEKRLSAPVPLVLPPTLPASVPAAIAPVMTAPFIPGTPVAAAPLQPPPQQPQPPQVSPAPTQPSSVVSAFQQQEEVRSFERSAHDRAVAMVKHVSTLDLNDPGNFPFHEVFRYVTDDGVPNYSYIYTTARTPANQWYDKERQANKSVTFEYNNKVNGELVHHTSPKLVKLNGVPILRSEKGRRADGHQCEHWTRAYLLLPEDTLYVRAYIYNKDDGVEAVNMVRYFMITVHGIQDICKDDYDAGIAALQLPWQ